MSGMFVRQRAEKISLRTGIASPRSDMKRIIVERLEKNVGD